MAVTRSTDSSHEAEASFDRPPPQELEETLSFSFSDPGREAGSSRDPVEKTAIQQAAVSVRPMRPASQGFSPFARSG